MPVMEGPTAGDAPEDRLTSLRLTVMSRPAWRWGRGESVLTATINIQVV
jgi:hypothetical protein